MSTNLSMTKAQFRRAKSTSQVSMFFSGEAVKIGDNYLLGKDELRAVYAMKIERGMTAHSFVMNVLDELMKRFYMVMGYCYRHGESQIQSGEVYPYFKSLISFMDKEVKAEVDRFYQVATQSYIDLFNSDSNIEDAKVTNTRRKNNKVYEKKIEASKWKGLSIKDRHLLERDVKSEHLYKYLLDNGYIDPKTNTRTMSIDDMLKGLLDSEDNIPVIEQKVFSTSRRDLAYVFAKFGVKGRKTGRKTTKSVDKADVVSDNGLEVVVPVDKTPVDTDNCTKSEAATSDKSVSATPRIIHRRTITRKEETFKFKHEEKVEEPVEYVEKPIETSRSNTIARGRKLTPEQIAHLEEYHKQKMEAAA